MEKRDVTPSPRPPTPIEAEGELRSRAREGFLPFHTNAFDRVFIGVMILIGIHLLWLRFMEPALPIEAATVLSLVIGYVVVRRG